MVNRPLVPYLPDAVCAFEEGFGSIDDIKQGMKLGCNRLMGPFTLMDFPGIGTSYSLAETLFNECRETGFAPPTLPKRTALAGMYGRKSGKGLYHYSDP